MKTSRLSFLLRGIWLASCRTIGGQAVMDGVMLRNRSMYALAVRGPDGRIISECRPWRVLARHPLLEAPFLRGFPILLETMLNGIGALNRSVELAGGEAQPQSRGQAVAGVALAVVFALGLFVVAPHLLSLCMHALNLGDDVDGLVFHLWDGFFKTAIFVAYISLIGFIPEIRRVFEYHGAEHKTIHAYERGMAGDPAQAAAMSRLHPRCGTTFLLFVICLSIILQAFCVPLFLMPAASQGLFLKHSLALAVKLFLVVPISALAYELIRFAARLPQGAASFLLQAPGLALQRLTTREPDDAQLEVAASALAAATRPDGVG